MERSMRHRLSWTACPSWLMAQQASLSCELTEGARGGFPAWRKKHERTILCAFIRSISFEHVQVSLSERTIQHFLASGTFPEAKKRREAGRVPLTPLLLSCSSGGNRASAMASRSGTNEKRPRLQRLRANSLPLPGDAQASGSESCGLPTSSAAVCCQHRRLALCP